MSKFTGATFMVVSTGDRAEGLEVLLRSIAADPVYASWPVDLCLQQYTTDQIADLRRAGANLRYLTDLSDLQGPYVARWYALRNALADGGVWINLDDDMRLMPLVTCFGPAVEKARQEDVGIVSCGWIRSNAFLAKKKVVHEFVKQPIVYTGGGYVYGEHVAQLVRNNDQRGNPPLFDNVEWSLLTYLEGLENFRYRGSLAYHAICSKGGRKRWTESDRRRLPDERWLACPEVRNREGANIPDSAALTPGARYQHQKAREGVLARLERERAHREGRADG